VTVPAPIILRHVRARFPLAATPPQRIAQAVFLRTFPYRIKIMFLLFSSPSDLEGNVLPLRSLVLSPTSVHLMICAANGESSLSI